MTIKVQPLGFVFRMSRGQKLLELALLANNDQPVTFIVNVDGSLSQVEGNRREPPIEVNSAHEVLDHNYSVSGLNLSDVIDDIDKNDDLSPYLDLGSILGTEADSLNCIGQITNPDLVAEKEILPEDDISFPENPVDIPDQENLSKNDLNLPERSVVIPEQENLGEDSTNLSQNLVDIPDLGNLPEDDINLPENSIVPPEEENFHEDNINLPQNPVNIPEQQELPGADENLLVIADPQVIDNANHVAIRKRKKRHQVKAATWKINQWKEARKNGKEYCGKKKNNTGQYEYDIKKNAREMKVRCKCQRKENSLLQCASFTESDRKKTSKNFGNWTGRGKRYL